MRNQEQRGTVLEAEKAKVKPPPLYKVMLLNDDYTPMDFVVVVLQTVFAMSREKATQVMLQVHREGMGVCGMYTREVARPRSNRSSTSRASTSIRFSARWRRLKRYSRRQGSGVRRRKGEGRSMIAQELEVSLHMAFVEARQKQHEFITVEHLLLAHARQPVRRRGAEGLRRRPGRAARRPVRVHPGAHAAACAALRRGHAADAGLPARHPARDPPRAVVRQEGSHRRQRAGRDLRREGVARGLLPEPAGVDAPRRRQLHLARHHQDAAAEAGQAGEQGRRRERQRVAGRARRVHAQPQRARARPARSIR